MVAALWVREAMDEQWLLWISPKSFDGRTSFYASLADVLTKLRGQTGYFEISSVRAIEPTNSIVRELKKFGKVSPDRPMHLQSVSLSGVYLKEGVPHAWKGASNGSGNAASGWRSARSSRTGWCGATPATGSASARVWHDDGRMMATWFQGTADEFIAVSRAGFEQGRQHPAFPRRQLGRHRRRPRHLADQDDDLAARARARRAVRRGLHRPLLRLLREARRALGHRAAPADLREGPHGPGRSRRAADARSGAARPLSRGLSPPRLSADRRSATR